MKTAFFVLTLLLSFGVRATHLVGGMIELKWNGGDSYTIRVKVLRDCENGNPGAYFDNPIVVGIFEKGTHIKKNEFSLNFSRANDDTLSFTGANCANIITGCTHIGSYSANVTLNSNVYNSNNGYYLSWQRCCRNGIIQNIVNPGDASMALYTEVPNLKTVKNSSPKYLNNPVTLLCVNNLFEYNMNFVDDDGDELKFSFIEPVNGGLDRDQPSSNTALPGPYPNVVYLPNYSNAGPIMGTVPLEINPITGLIKCNPSNPGVFVASIRVEEFRFGVKIGEVRLELQFSVTICPNNPPLSSITTVNDQLILEDTVEIPVYEKVCFKIRGIDLEDSVYLQVRMGEIDSSIKELPVFDTLVTGVKSVQTTVCWQGACEHEGMPAVPFFVNLRDNGCPIARNAESKFYVKFTPMPKVPSTDLLCMTLADFKETTVYLGDSSDPTDPFFSYYLVFRGINNANYQVIDTLYNKVSRLLFDPNTPDYHKINYTYYMVGVNRCGDLGQTSDTLGTFEQLEFIPQKQFLKSVTVKNNKELEITWPQTPERDFAKYYLYKAENGSTKFNELKVFENITDTQYIDQEVNVASTSYCYYLVMLDTCENMGPVGKMACSMVLRGTALPFKNSLSFNGYEGWQGGVESHSIMRADPATPFSKIGNPSSGSFRYIDDALNFNEGLFYYYVMAKERNALSTGPFFDAQSVSNTIELYQAPFLYVPNAFTANGDGLNDKFQWLPVFVKDLEIEIFNRWGEKVFESKDKLAQWDGKYKGDPVQADVYFYLITYTGYEGTRKSTSGNFTLLR
jgi:gliding motility-associated-like protein